MRRRAVRAATLAALAVTGIVREARAGAAPRIAVVVSADDLGDSRLAVIRDAAEKTLRRHDRTVVSQAFGASRVPPRKLDACAERGADCVRRLLGDRGIDRALLFVVRVSEPIDDEESTEIEILVRLLDASTGELLLVDRRLCPSCGQPERLIRLVDEVTAECARVERGGPTPAPELDEAIAAPARAGPPRPFRVLKYVTVGVGLGAVAGGIALLSLESGADGSRGTRGGGIALSAVGAGLVIGGVMMWIQDDRARSRARVRAGVGLLPGGGAAITAAGRF